VEAVEDNRESTILYFRADFWWIMSEFIRKEANKFRNRKTFSGLRLYNR